ncbi:hypothetical protein ACSBR2_003479 [Camellia fascicularis]
MNFFTHNNGGNSVENALKAPWSSSPFIKAHRPVGLKEGWILQRDSVTLVCDVSHFHSLPEECELAVWCGPCWEVQMARRDSLTASITAANNNIPGPNSSVATLVTKFQNVGLTLNVMVTLSGNIIFIYYVNLISGEGLLASDQILVTGDDQTREIVESYANNPAIFFEEFKKSMLKMGNLGPLTGEDGEVRKNCRSINQF